MNHTAQTGVREQESETAWNKCRICGKRFRDKGRFPTMRQRIIAHLKAHARKEAI